jgi:hypothetical protein
MKQLLFSLCLSLLPISTFAQKPVDLVEVGQDHFESDFPSGGQLRMHIRSGEIRIVGSDDNKVRVHYDGEHADRFHNVRVSLQATGNNGELRVSGGPKNRFEIEIAVPKSCDLSVRIPAGDVTVKGITGDKDIQLTAGELTIDVGKADDYSSVDASVYTGDLDAEAFGVDKGGLFRSLHQHGPGKYRLRAHVGTGELQLRAAGSEP